MKQLEWCGYPTVKKFDDILYIQPFQHNTSVWRTDDILLQRSPRYA